MKKTALYMVVLLFISVTLITPVAATTYTDAQTGVTYTILSETVELSQECVIVNANIFSTVPSMTSTIYGMLGDPDTTRLIELREEEFAETIRAVETHCTHRQAIFLPDGEPMQIPERDIPFYKSFFELDDTFVGATAFEVQGITITLTTTATGQLWIAVEADVQGIYETTLTKPHTVEYTKVNESVEETVGLRYVKRDIVSEEYPNGILISKTFDTLHDALAYYQENAFLDIPAQIHYHALQRVVYQGTVSDEYVLTIQYGSHSPQTTRDEGATAVPTTTVPTTSTAAETTTAATTTFPTTTTTVVTTAATALTTAATTSKTMAATTVAMTTQATAAPTTNATARAADVPRAPTPSNWLGYVIGGAVAVLAVAGILVTRLVILPKRHR